MEMNEYQQAAGTTAVYPGQGTTDGIVYTTLGLVGEAGEIANKVKKILRDDAPTDGLGKELGDVLWYIAMLADELDIGLEEVALDNLLKLRSRKRRNQLQGSGDNR